MRQKIVHRSSSSSSSNWILMSCQPHRITSGQSNSGKQIHNSKLFSHIYQPSVKSIYKTNHFANIKYTYTIIRHDFQRVSSEGGGVGRERKEKEREGKTKIPWLSLCSPNNNTLCSTTCYIHWPTWMFQATNINTVRALFTLALYSAPYSTFFCWRGRWMPLPPAAIKDKETLFNSTKNKKFKHLVWGWAPGAQKQEALILKPAFILFQCWLRPQKPYRDPTDH